METRTAIDVMTDADRFVPVFLIHESPVDYEIEANVPDAAPSDVQIEANGRDVTIRCRRVLDRFAARDLPKHGAFTRRFRFNDHVDFDRVVGELRGGVLRIHVPKAAAKARAR